VPTAYQSTRRVIYIMREDCEQADRPDQQGVVLVHKENVEVGVKQGDAAPTTRARLIPCSTTTEYAATIAMTEMLAMAYASGKPMCLTVRVRVGRRGRALRRS